MTDFDRVLPVKERALARLMTLPGVHGVGVGEKYVNGKSTGEPSILILVAKKRPLEQLKPEEVVPSEIEGIKTDVIEVPEPQLDMAANPANMVATVSANQLAFTLSGQNEPGAGLILWIEFTATPAAAPGFFVIPCETYGSDTLASIATRIAGRFSGHGGLAGLTAAAVGPTVTVTPPTGGTLAITNAYVTAIDDHQYFDQWVRGGIQLALKGRVQGSGTLGCLATTAPTAADPQGKVVAITNHHVVRPDTNGATNLAAVPNAAVNGQFLISSNDGHPITPRSVLSVAITVATGTAEALYLTVQGDSPASVASGAAAVITGLALAGVNAAPGAGTLTITGAGASVEARGPLLPSGDFRAAVDRNTINYSGTVDNDDHGIFLDIHPGGTAPSFGVFVNPPNNTNGDGMATLVLQAFQRLPAAVVGSVTMGQTGSTLTLTNVELVESRITDDIRVGQPDPSFGSSCCHCCSHQIGRVLDARFDLDVALIQLDPDIKYKPEIQDLGLVAGIVPPAQPMTVYRRGRTSQRTTIANAGIIRGLNISIKAKGTLRLSSNSYLVQSVSHSSFGAPGDSGSAVVDLSGNVVGIHWGGSDVWSYGTPINLVVAAFPALALNLAPAPAAGHAAGDVRTVPKPAAHMAAVPEATAESMRPVMVSRLLEDRLLEAEREIAAAPVGKKYADLIRGHFEEGQRLINGNRRVATAWHRNGGPELLQAIFRIIQSSEQRLPVEFNGKPLSECLARLLRVMARYASPQLAADLENHAPALAGMAGLSYNDVLSTLHSWPEER
jgi:hypothetical protein